MKKSLIALAVLAASGAAMAQSSVTLYGRLDVGANTVKKTDAKGVSTTTNDLTGSQNERNTSRLGVKGTEDLGGGLKVNFVAETGLNPTDAAALFSGNTRQASVDVEGGFGRVGFGTGYNGLDDLRGFSAGMGGSPAGADFGYQFHNPSASASNTGLDGRSRNTLGYASKFGDVTVKVGLHSQKGAVTTTSKDAAGKDVTVGTKSNGAIVGVGYAAGPLAAHFAYGVGKAEVVNGAKTLDKTDGGVAVSYNFGMAAPYAIYEQSKEKLADKKTTTVELGAKFPMGAVTPYVSLNRADVDTKGTSVKTDGFQLGMNYALSKRTDIYSAYGQQKVKNTSTKVQGMNFGLQHRF